MEIHAVRTYIMRTKSTTTMPLRGIGRRVATCTMDNARLTAVIGDKAILYAFIFLLFILSVWSVNKFYYLTFSFIYRL